MALLSCSGKTISVFSRCNSTAPSTFYDAVIVGGGMVGTAMACNMGLSDLLQKKKVLLLESADPKPLSKTPIFSNRTSAINPASVDFFRRIGVWDKLQDYRVKRVDRLEMIKSVGNVQKIKVIDGCSRSTINFAQPNHEKEVSHIIENNVVVATLFDRVREACSNVTVKTKTKVTDCRIPDSLLDDATLTLSDGSKVETTLVIGADGGRSAVRQALGVKYTSWEYSQKGVVAVVELEGAGENNIAWQRFTPYGPVALLPLSKNMSNLIWTTNDTHAEELLSITPQEFIDVLNHFLFTNANQSQFTNSVLSAVDNIVDTLFRTGKTEIPVPPRVVGLQTDNRAAFPLVFGHSHSYVGTRAALIGDAAHRIHPLGGQGVNLGWADVQKLGTCLEKSVADGADLGALTYLSEYDTQGQRQNIPVQLACDWINRLYRHSFTPIVFIRSLGLYGVNKITPLKKMITAQMASPS